MCEELAKKVSQEIRKKIDSFIIHFYKLCKNKTEDETFEEVNKRYTFIVEYERLTDYFCASYPSHMFDCAFHRQDVPIMKMIVSQYKYAPFKSIAEYFLQAVHQKEYETVKFIIENDGLLYKLNEFTLDVEYQHKFDILIKRQRYDIIHLILDRCAKNEDGEIIMKLILVSCSIHEQSIVERICNEYRFLETQTDEDIHELISTVIYQKNTYLLSFLSNQIVEKQLPVPNIHIKFIDTTNEDRFHEIFHVAFPFGYFEQSLRIYFESEQRNASRHDVFRFLSNKRLSFLNCPLDETYVTYCLKKGMVTMNETNCSILTRLIEHDKFGCVKELFLHYHLDIPNRNKEDLVKLLLDKMGVRVSPFTDFFKRSTNKSFECVELLETILNHSHLNFNKIFSLTTYFFVQLIQRDNLPIIRLFVEHGIDININDGHALRRAIYRNYQNILEYLLKLPNIQVNKTHFTRKQYRYLDRKNKLDPYMVRLFETYNPAVIQNIVNVNTKLLVACSTQKVKQIEMLLASGADIFSLGTIQTVFHHPVYKQNDFILEQYARKYFALKRISRILFGRRGIVHNVQYKLGRKRVYAEFDSLEEHIHKKVRLE